MTYEKKTKIKERNCKGGFIRCFLSRFLPVAFVLGILFLVFYFNELRNINLVMDTKERNLIEIVFEHIDNAFEALQSDLMVVAGHSAMEGAFKGDPSAIAELKREFSLFASKKKLYEQIRYIDETGMERIRVNHRDGVTGVVSDEELQSKAHRYYFKQGMKLPPGDVYYSALDLNIEHGKIEVPHRPMLRAATPVYDSEAVRRGLLVLNYSALDLVEHIKGHGLQAVSTLMLVNPEGYWLVGGKEGDNFAFQFKGKEDRRLSADYPLAWDRVSAHVAGQFLNAEGMFTFRTFDLSSDRFNRSALDGNGHHQPHLHNGSGSLSEEEASGDKYWKVISFMPQELHNAAARSLRVKLMLVYLGVMLVAAVISWGYALARLRHRVAEDTLLDNERRFKAIMDNSTALICVKDLQGRYQFINRRFQKVFKVSMDGVKGKSVHDIFPPERAEGIKVNDRLVLDRKGPVEFEEEVPHPSGDRTYLSVRFPLLDSSGEPYAICGMATDITERKKAEEDFRKSRQKLALHIEQTPLAVIDWNTDFEVVGWNHSAERIFGYTAEEAMGCHAAGLIVPESVGGYVDQVWQDLLANRGGRRSTNENITKEGSSITCDWYNTPLIDSMGEVMGVSSLVMDITERKHTEKALETLYKSSGGSLGQEFFDGVVESLYEWLDADCVIVGEKYDGENIRVLSMKFDGKKVEDFSYALPGTPCAEVIGGEAICIYPEDVAGLFPYDEILTEMGAVGYVGTILQDKDGVPSGVICALTRKRLELPPDATEVLELVAARASAELERMHAEQEVLKVNRSLKAISECNEALVHASDEETLLDEICRIIIKTGGYRMVWVGYAEDDEEKTVRPVAKDGIDAGYVDSLNISWGDNERGRGPTGTSIRTSVFSVARNLATEKSYNAWREEAAKRGYASSIALPLINNEKVLGALNIYAGEVDAFNDEEISLLMELAKDLAYGIATLRAHEEHRKAESTATHLGRILEDSLNEIYIFDVESLRFVEVNKGARDNTGYTMEELRCLTPADIKPETTVDDFKALIEPLKGKKVDRLLLSKTENRRKDGSTYPVDVYLQLSTFESKPVFVAIILDITERRKAESSATHLGRILEESLNEIYIFDVESLKFIQVNRGARENTGYTMEELSGLTPVDLKPEMSIEDFSSYLEPLKTGKLNRTQFSTVHRRKDGTLYPVDVYLQLSNLDDSPVFVGIILDTTKRIKAEQEIIRLNESLERQVMERTSELQAVNKELESFAYSVSHDLRAPLRGIDGFSQALREDFGDTLDGDARNYLNRICSATKHMGELIKDMLALSKVTRSELRRESVDMTLLAERVAGHLKKAAPERSVDVVIQPELVANDADSHLVRIILENLMGNAWKFTAKKDQAVIEFGQKEIDGEQVFYVRDNGAGFDMAYAAKLFGAFQRLHTVDEFEGTGIGLATVQRIVHRHGGRIWAEAEVGKGAAFYFTLG